MAFDARVYSAVIAAPGDTDPYRAVIERTVAGWNRTRAKREQALYLARHWSTDSVPELGDSDGQSFINKQLVDEADVLFAVFHGRLGHPTPRGASGTAEEITRAADAGKQVHVYFVEAPLPYDHEPEQLEALKLFRKTLEDRGLYRAVTDPSDLEGQVRSALDYDVEKLGGGGVAAAPATKGAELRLKVEADREQYTDSKNRIQYRTRGHRLIIRNVGTAMAESVRVTFKSLQPEEEPLELIETVTPNISPQGDYTFNAVVTMGTATHCRALLNWTEGGEERSDTQDFPVR